MGYQHRIPRIWLCQIRMFHRNHGEQSASVARNVSFIVNLSHNAIFAPISTKLVRDVKNHFFLGSWHHWLPCCSCLQRFLGLKYTQPTNRQIVIVALVYCEIWRWNTHLCLSKIYALNAIIMKQYFCFGQPDIFQSFYKPIEVYVIDMYRHIPNYMMMIFWRSSENYSPGDVTVWIIQSFK